MKIIYYVVISILLCLTLPGIISSVFAEDGFPESYSWNPYEGWDLDLVSKISNSVFPMVEVSEIPTTIATEVPKTGPDYWVKLAYYPSGFSKGQPALLAGYVGGKNYNAKVTLSAKKDASDDFHDIIIINPQENGVFVWAVPDKLKDVGFYQATATIGGIPVYSEIVKTSGVSAYAPVPTSTTVSPKTTGKAVATALPAITTLTLSSNTLNPAVGDDVELYGRLKDSYGKGVSGMKISIEAPDYGTDFLPLISTTTGSDGSFSATIKTYEAGVVPVQAVFEGTDQYMGSTSNTLIFSTKSK